MSLVWPGAEDAETPELRLFDPAEYRTGFMTQADGRELSAAP